MKTTSIILPSIRHSERSFTGKDHIHPAETEVFAWVLKEKIAVKTPV